mmetsp:Transcript_15306/g.41939  ORF Transcript_15306/g.41939 Transcript_15306/m.41939 type:complete len:202 (-) Transcript_15306:506-1111(-)
MRTFVRRARHHAVRLSQRHRRVSRGLFTRGRPQRPSQRSRAKRLAAARCTRSGCSERKWRRGACSCWRPKCCRHVQAGRNFPAAPPILPTRLPCVGIAPDYKRHARWSTLRMASPVFQRSHRSRRHVPSSRATPRAAMATGRSTSLGCGTPLQPLTKAPRRLRQAVAAPTSLGGRHADGCCSTRWRDGGIWGSCRGSSGRW